MYNREWLRQQLISYLKDNTQQTADALDTFIDIGAARCQQVLRCWEMEEQIYENQIANPDIAGQIVGGTAAGQWPQVVISGGDAARQDDLDWLPYVALPARVIEVLGVETLGSNGQYTTLYAIDGKAASWLRGAQGRTGYYEVQNRRVYAYGGEAGYRLQVISKFEIPIGDLVPQVLTSYPFVFLNAALAEAYDWKQDENQRALYENKWFTEATTIAGDWRSDRLGEGFAMQGV